MGTVLVIDDDGWVRQALSDALRQEGYEVMLARDGVDGLEKLKTRRPDVILQDVRMPRMDGWHFLSARLRDPEIVEIPVILMTAHSAAMTAGKRAGAVRVIAKPFQLDELLDAIEQAIARTRPVVAYLG
jgi:two-component system chemotaxis response regulator CheY